MTLYPQRIILILFGRCLTIDVVGQRVVRRSFTVWFNQYL